MLKFGRGSFKLPKNKKFNYTPRHYEGKKIDNPYDFDSVIRKDREAIGYNDLRGHWSEARANSRHRGNRSFNLRVLIIVLILLLIFLYIIDFDLSIFKK
ncbi:hypothetical protein NHF50_10855 [Flavobacterium sp. NRK F10]|uniref:Riboflavin synthase subunit beta n=1 Tax=Flavobacterium sediminis TaxID=2201181 RepID=A0A2U8QVU2_9FLAO|nr:MULTISPECIES: hypothetical protein [Flavobacterium]AWM14322.1 hypothetical protein DI487_10965 [Flavobacterium sediminis]MCO6175540.1 hypothetical protein [Flavobacterium sp. NRK F10]